MPYMFLFASSQDKASQRCPPRWCVKEQLEQIGINIRLLGRHDGQDWSSSCNCDKLSEPEKRFRCFSKCWKRHCSAFKHFALLLFCISTISSETKTGSLPRCWSLLRITNALCRNSPNFFLPNMESVACHGEWQLLHVDFACTYRWHRCRCPSPIWANSIILCWDYPVKLLSFRSCCKLYGTSATQMEGFRRKSTDSVNIRNTASLTLNVLNPVSIGILHISWCSLSSINTMTLWKTKYFTVREWWIFVTTPDTAHPTPRLKGGSKLHLLGFLFQVQNTIQHKPEQHCAFEGILNIGPSLKPDFLSGKQRCSWDSWISGI